MKENGHGTIVYINVDELENYTNEDEEEYEGQKINDIQKIIQIIKSEIEL